MEKSIFEYKDISRNKLDEILSRIPKIQIALIGDICLDIYWKADMTKSVISRETPHFPLPVVEEWMSPGAGGNTAANIAALGASLTVLSVIGSDWRGAELKSALQQRGIKTDAIIESDKLVTNAYCKPLRHGISETVYEDPRLDFANYCSLPRQEEQKLIYALDKIAGDIDALCVCDQFTYGCITPKVRDKISELGKKGMLVTVDSREKILHYKNTTIKPNELEGASAAFEEFDPNFSTFELYSEAALILSQKTGNKVCMTLGDKGCIYAEEGALYHIPTKKVDSPIDICGAGDTFLSAFTCAQAAGAKGYEAALFANIASSISIKKINTTGTANPDEIRIMHKEFS
jgi:rfaE bifunctional protein kinase chain/domain